MSHKPQDSWDGIDFGDEKNSDKIPASKPLVEDSIMATPYMVSSLQAKKIQAFSEKTDNYPSHDELVEMGLDMNQWYENYFLDEDELFYPKNRWVHECVLKPKKIEKNLYLIKISSDIYMQQNYFPVKYKNGEFIDIPELKIRLLSRTLHQHQEDSDVDNFILFSEQENKNNFEQFSWNWVIRWLPKFDCTLTFFTDKEIEDKFNIFTPKVVIDYKYNHKKDIIVPFFINKKFYKNTAYLKHDSDILYMRMEKK